VQGLPEEVRDEARVFSKVGPRRSVKKGFD
jgi:hypothetical protein